jgi:hypothetical protein
MNCFAFVICFGCVNRLREAKSCVDGLREAKSQYFIFFGSLLNFLFFSR